MAETVFTEPGHEFSIVLEGTPTTGFVWQLVRPLEKIGLLEELGEEYEPRTSLAGGATKQHFRFRALSAGEITLHFVYRRPWEASAPREDREFVIRIAV